jgi:hypothetical protein
MNNQVMENQQLKKISVLFASKIKICCNLEYNVHQQPLKEQSDEVPEI